MNLQWAGPILAFVTFATIALGHILVRYLHASFGTRPAVALFLVGASLMAGSAAASQDLLSGVLGITAITLVWDGVEIFRQEKRFQRDRFPKNTRNL